MVRGAGGAGESTYWPIERSEISLASISLLPSLPVPDQQLSEAAPAAALARLSQGHVSQGHVSTLRLLALYWGREVFGTEHW